MTRQPCAPRNNFQGIIAAQGLVYSTNGDGSAYWNEEACYVLSEGEVDALYRAARELHGMFLAAAECVLRQPNGLDELGIPPILHDVIRRSWEADEWELYGRFDLTLDGDGVPKLIEYNADTPTGLLEASVIQWYWKEACFPEDDQFNSIHESLVARWRELVARGQLQPGLTHFTSVGNHAEDRMTVGYLAATAEEAGLPIQYLAIDQIGWEAQNRQFVDLEARPIRQMFKLYPWEWLGTEAFAPHLLESPWTILEPAWKAIWSSKRLLLTLNQLYPDHPSLLEVSDRPLTGNWVRKPVFGREGANVTIQRDGLRVLETKGRFADGDFIYQEFCPLIQAEVDRFAQCGVWMAGPEPVGLGMREDTTRILRTTSPFIPHLLV